MEILFVSSNQVGCNVMLGRVEIYLPGTHQLVQCVFELVFDVRVPGLRLEGLGPQVLQGIAAPQL
jgi:hypothetical protein